jgi:hypothetical protein
MCDRTEDELLAAPGETSVVGPDFACDAIRDPQRMARFHVIGFGYSEAETEGVVSITETDLAIQCEQVRQGLPSLTLIQDLEILHPVVYVSIDQGSPQDTLIRLVFEPQIVGGGLIVTTCEQASRVDAAQVCFWQRP